MFCTIDSGSLCHCPACTAPIEIVFAGEDPTVHVVDEDGRRRVGEPQQQTHLTVRGPEEAGWTLQRWWSERVRPAMVEEGRSKDRIGQYETYLRRWESCCVNHWTTRPVVSDISPVTLGQYKSYLTDELKVTQSAAEKHVKGVSALLQRAEHAWILPRVPRLEFRGKRKPNEGLKWNFEPEDMDALYAACDGVQWPAKFSDGWPCENPADYWRLLLVAGWNYGFRLQEWWSYERLKDPPGAMPTPIRWRGIVWDRTTEIEGQPATSRHGWACWRSNKTDYVYRLPMHDALRRHLRVVWDRLPEGRRAPETKVFDFPLSAGTKKPGRKVQPKNGWYAAWWDLVDRAGLRPQLDESGKHITYLPSQFRKTAHTRHRDNVVTIDGKDVQVKDSADFVTGHSGSRNVSLRHYYRSVAIVIATCESLAQPSSFL